MSASLEDRLREALVGARTDDRFAVAPHSTTVAGVRRAARASQRRTRAAVSLAALSVVGVGALTVAQTGGTAGDETLQPAAPRPASAGPSAAPVPVPGISPAFLPAHGRDWWLTEAEGEAFARTHALPSSGPGQSVVPSPAPLGPRSARLAAEAALPDGARVEREDSDSGDPDVTALHVTLADGTPVEVERERLQLPLTPDDLDDGTGGTVGVADVAGTTSIALSRAESGYGWPDPHGEGARLVLVVAADGEATTWLAPLSVPLDTVRSWAVATEQGRGPHSTS